MARTRFGNGGREAIDGRNARRIVLASLAVAAFGLLPPGAQAQDRAAREAIAVADGLGQLGVVLRAYGQLGLQVKEAEAAELLAQARADLDAGLQRLLRRGAKRLPAAEGERLGQRWRSVRDATYTRPSPEIGALMSDIGEDIAVQLRALVPDPPSGATSRALFERAWQRQNLQWLAKEGIFGCWRGDLVRWSQLDQLKADFGRWLAGQEKQLSPVNWVQYNSQWNLLTTSLPRPGSHGCTRQSMASLAATADRLVRMIATQP
jgi:hypothetical protein